MLLKHNGLCLKNVTCEEAKFGDKIRL